jgi:uncharacterized cupredoxin-like copper-binding protein
MASHTITRRLLPLVGLVAALALLAALLAGGSPADAKTTIRLSAKESGGLSFSKKLIRTSGGKVTLVMKASKSLKLPHAIAVEGKGVDKSGKKTSGGRAGRSRVTVTLKKGRTYTFYCPVDGHRAAGMVGTIRVRG